MMAGWRHAIAAALLAVPVVPAAAALPASERTIGSWSIVCVKAPMRRCLASQVVAADSSGRQIVLGATVTAAGGAALPVLHLRVGPGVDRSAGFGIKLDAASELRLPVDGCTFKMCQTSGRLSPAIRTRFARARVAQIAWRDSSGRQTLVPLNLRDFERVLLAIGVPPPTRPARIT